MSLISSRPDNDIVDYMRMLERRLARLERGTQGNSGGDDPAVVTSLAITGLSLSTQTVIVADDFYRVMMRYSWNAIPDDPSEYNKDALDGYLTSWSRDGTNYTADTFTTDTFVDVGPFQQGQSVTFRVRARTEKGTLGAYTARTDSTTTDATAPFQPSTPVVSPYLGQLAIDWNGLDVSSGQPPTDFRFCEVHISTTSPTFTPTVATLVGTILRGGGVWIATDLTYGSTYYSRLVAVDTVGNRSPASTAGSAIPEQLVNGDMGPNSIATANIQNLAVNNAKIADLAVGKLTAGTLTANMTVSARIMTASTGARVELNSSGLQAFNSSGTQTVDIAASTGNATITGAFQTDFPSSATPHLQMVNSGDRTTIYFTNNVGAGNNDAFMNSPITGTVPRLGLNTGAFTYLGVGGTGQRLFLAAAGGIELGSNNVNGQVGYCLVMLDTQMRLLGYNSSGQKSGASYEGFSSSFDIRQFSAGVAVGGQVEGTASILNLTANDGAGAAASRIILNGNDAISFEGGLLANIGGAPAIYTGHWDAVNVGGGGGLSYGFTMPSGAWVNFMVAGATNPGAHWVTSQNATGFNVRTTTSATYDIVYWNIRFH